jgi:hypothetical protein
MNTEASELERIIDNVTHEITQRLQHARDGSPPRTCGRIELTSRSMGDPDEKTVAIQYNFSELIQ